MESITSALAHSISAACSQLSLGRTLLYELISRGEIRSIKVGRKTLIPDSELRRFIDERMRDLDASHGA